MRSEGHVRFLSRTLVGALLLVAAAAPSISAQSTSQAPSPNGTVYGATASSATDRATATTVHAAGVGTVNNGGFETGNFSNWVVVDQDGGDGSWFVYSGTAAPLSGFAIDAPSEGRFAAVADQRNPGSHILYQDISLPAGRGY